jgi:hypothetical protein
MPCHFMQVFRTSKAKAEGSKAWIEAFGATWVIT